MLHRLLLPLFVFTVSAFAGTVEPHDISADLEAIRVKHHLPACASAVVENGQVTVLGAAGLRRVDGDGRVGPDDLWHIASCTKSMTATLVGILVDAGELRWDMSVAEALPDVSCHAGWHNVTLWHLVTQRSGMAPFTRRNWLALAPSAGPLREQRVTLVKSLLARPPSEAPGRFAYSNAGYGLIGAIIEHATGEDYEDLLRKHIFAPLDLKSAGFGAPLGDDQPWGHLRGENGVLVPVDPAATGGQFPRVLSPAGSVHMAIADFARYAWWISTNEPPLVKAETFTKLHTPPEDSTYAGGMWTTFLPGIGGEAVCHTGHQGGFFAVFHAGRERACVSVFNTEGGGWEWLGDEISAAALKASK